MKQMSTLWFRAIFLLLFVALCSGCTPDYFSGLPAEALCEKGFSAMEEYDMEEAGQYFQMAVEADPTYAQSYIGLGRLAEARWDILAAIGYYEAAAACEEDWSQGCLRAAELYAVTGNPVAGQALLDAAYERTEDPDFVKMELGGTSLTLGTYMTDLSPLAEESWSHIEQLTLHTPGCTDYTPVGQMKGLRELSITSSGLTDLSFLKGLEGLESLDLMGNCIEDLGPIPELDTLEILDLRENPKFASIDGLEGLPNLTNLYLGRTKVADLTPAGELCAADEPGPLSPGKPVPL